MSEDDASPTSPVADARFMGLATVFLRGRKIRSPVSHCTHTVEKMDNIFSVEEVPHNFLKSSAHCTADLPEST